MVQEDSRRDAEEVAEEGLEEVAEEGLEEVVEEDVNDGAKEDGMGTGPERDDTNEREHSVSPSFVMLTTQRW